MQTGEDTNGLRKIIDLTRGISIAILCLHFYITCYQVFAGWHWTANITDHLISNIARTGLFGGLWKAKWAALLLLAVSLIGSKGKKDEHIRRDTIAMYIGAGLLFYLGGILCLYLRASYTFIAVTYMAVTSMGYLLILTGGGRLSRLLKANLNKDIFNRENETFPQEERLLENEYSVNLPAEYHYKDKSRKSWINIINPFRGLLVAGTPGAGKSYFVIRHIIEQHIKKGFSMFLYDFKYPDLSLIVYNALLKYRHNYKVKPSFWVIDFDHIQHQCNPLHPESMEDITDASESSRTIMLGLNREWIRKQGDFFVESPINFLTAIIWYLRKYQNGRYCTLPHVIELMRTEYDQLFPILMEEPEISILVDPFVSAYRNKAMNQLEGQIASAKISLARLSSPKLYYVLSGNDFTLDINNPAAPKIVCIGNNPQKQQVYGAVLSLFVSRMIKLANRKGQLKSSLLFDEFPTIFINNMDSLIATARSNKVSTTLAVQDFSQLRKDYGKEQADVIPNIVGNIICGQVTGDTAKQLSERFGKIMQDRTSLSINSSDTSVSRSKQLEHAIPASRISALSSGEFVGMVADDPDNKIDLKLFHSEIQNDHEAIRKETDAYKPIPAARVVTEDDIMENYERIKEEIRDLVETELAPLLERKKAELEKEKQKTQEQQQTIETQKPAEDIKKNDQPGTPPELSM
ncbi:type IV secretory system conjugative DNA transfer VirD4/TraG family protein [Mucilaginibacter gracilis]|uniref:Type IV secretory system conjugative DNA transfer VirD4/TraG family protein n=1 Tax=Mucilaginibacter gracilis TaxID=423350 RepID=A0A495J2X5_9SPHI|nr:conjugal transfer protein MobC [Mucilaginibacter gracilis]RKR83320.1 type IV secretory system conjugative DNA transfer VirD4/TraG family protein [Mucilaginibacter gracilis]